MNQHCQSQQTDMENKKKKLCHNSPVRMIFNSEITSIYNVQYLL